MAGCEISARHLAPPVTGTGRIDDGAGDTACADCRLGEYRYERARQKREKQRGDQRTSSESGTPAWQGSLRMP